jgi:hypothetical protein
MTDVLHQAVRLPAAPDPDRAKRAGSGPARFQRLAEPVDAVNLGAPRAAVRRADLHRVQREQLLRQRLGQPRGGARGLGAAAGRQRRSLRPTNAPRLMPPVTLAPAREPAACLQGKAGLQAVGHVLDSSMVAGRA